MRPVRYNVAASLDGYIAGPAGKFDWIGALLAAGQVDSVEVTVVPILLGGGVPLLPPGAARTALTLRHSRAYPSGMVGLTYAVRAPLS